MHTHTHTYTHTHNIHTWWTYGNSCINAYTQQQVLTYKAGHYWLEYLWPADSTYRSHSGHWTWSSAEACSLMIRCPSEQRYLLDKIPMYIYICVCIYIYVRVCVYAFMRLLWGYQCVCIYIYTYIYTHIHIYICTMASSEQWYMLYIQNMQTYLTYSGALCSNMCASKYQLYFLV